MKIGIDISQLAYKSTGVSTYLENFVNHLLKIDKKNEYVLFFSSLRRSLDEIDVDFSSAENITLKHLRFPPYLMDLMWNRLHIAPIEYFIGDVDLFITSDWTEPPAKKAKKGTIIYDMIVYKYPKETHERIIKVQKMKHKWVKKESDVVFTISESSKKDISEFLGIDSNKIKVIKPGIYPVKYF